jgi:DNA primase
MMNLADLVKEDFGILGNGRWLRSEVHSSLVVDTEKELFYFNSRGLRGTIVDYLTQVRGLSRQAAETIAKNRTAGMPVDGIPGGLQARFDKLVNLFHTSGRNDRDYWYRRGLKDPTIDRYKLGNYDGWNLIPIYDEGYFINFQCRKDIPEKRIRLWYKDMDFKPVLFNKDVLPFVESVFITEGMVDCILLNQLGFPSVCSTNGAMSWNLGWIKYFCKMKEITYIADYDRAGKLGANLVAKSLGLFRVKIVEFEGKADKYDSVDFFRDGGTIDSFRELIANSRYAFEVK